LPLVDVADPRRLRVTVFVEQDAASSVSMGDPVVIVDYQRPQRKIVGRVSRFSQALDPKSRAMLCEIWLDNHYQLYPGSFVQVTLRLKAPELPTIPSPALLVRNGQLLVAVVHNSRVKLTPVRTGIDDGQHVQIVSGVRQGDLVALNLPSELADGAVVQPLIAKLPPAGAAGAAGAAPPGPGSAERTRQGQRWQMGGQRNGQRPPGEPPPER
jgi:hypothetical protein